MSAPGPWRWPPVLRRRGQPATNPSPPPAAPPDAAARSNQPRPVPPLYPAQPVSRNEGRQRPGPRAGAGGPPGAGTAPAGGYVPSRTRDPIIQARATGNAPIRHDETDAGALAAAFAADFLSWDEADPGRRALALMSYTDPTAGETQSLGWSGRGRQRTELALPGTVVRLSTHRVLVHVRIRVTPFRRLPGAPTEHSGASNSPDVLAFPAAAPAPTHPHWEGLGSCWYELLVPLRAADGRWRVDIGAVIVVPPLLESDESGDAGAETPGDVGRRGS